MVSPDEGSEERLRSDADLVGRGPSGCGDPFGGRELAIASDVGAARSAPAPRHVAVSIRRGLLRFVPVDQPGH